MTTQLNNFDDLGILNSDSELPNDGFVAPLDGSQTAGTADARAPLGIDGKQAAGSVQEALAKLALGPNNEHLEELRPDLVNALRELVVEYRQEGMVARRHEIRRIRQARLFWQGLQYAWWNPQDMTWHLPYESKMYDDSAAAEMPRYQFVTNIYQAFGLSFISILSQDVPAKNIDQQLSQQNTMNQQIYGSSQALNSQAAGGYQNLLANPGYSQAQQSAITNASQSALGSSFDALAQNAANRAARTRNSAGYGELIDSLARTQGQDQANLAQQNQIAFANASRSDTLSALSGLSGLYGTDANLLGRAIGVPAQLLDASARNAASSGFSIGLGPGGLSFGVRG